MSAPESSNRVMVEEIAETLGIAVSTVYIAIRRGDIPSVKVGRLRIVTRERFEDWIAGKIAA